jgi:hypothetical protein
MRTFPLVVSLLFALLAGVRPADAQPQGLTLLMTASHTRVAPGGTLSLTIGAFNQGAPVPMDVYCVVLLPDGDTLFALRGAGMVGGRLSRLASLPPLVANVTLPTGFATTLEDFLTYTFNGAEPSGTYRFVLAAVRPGSLADGRVDGGDLLALASREVTLGPPLTTEVDPLHSASGTVTPLDGGRVTTTAADGTIYTLDVPAGAVAAPATVTLTPVIDLSGLSQPLAPLAAVRAEPSGLQFARPSRLTIDVPAGVPSSALAALLISDHGTRGELTPVATGTTSLALQVEHFSEVIIPIEPLGGIGGSSGFFEEAHRLFAAAVLDPSLLNVQLLLAQLEHWYDSHLSVLFSSGQSDEEALVAAVEEFTSWDILRVAVERQFGAVGVGVGPVRGMLTGRAIDGRTRAATGLALAFARANDRCLTGTAVAARLADAETAAAFAVLARQFFDTLATNQALSPTAVQVASPDPAAHGLDEASVGARICVKPQIVDVVEPSLGPGQSGALTVVAGVSFGGAPAVFTPTLGVRFCPDPAAPGVGCGQYLPTNTAGQRSFTVTANASGRVRYAVCAQIASSQQVPFYGLFLAFAAVAPAPCQSSIGGVVVTPAQTEIAPGASRQFTAVVEDTSIQDVTWTVTGGGTISATGLFTSNGTPGTFFVTATSVAEGSRGVAQVTVTGSGGGGEDGPCPEGCTFPGAFTLCNRGICNAPTQGSVTAFTFRPLPSNGRSGAISWVCGGSLISAEITRSNASFTGLVVRSSASCRDVGTTVNVPITGGLSASSLNFVVNVAGSTTTTLTFASAGVAVAASSREKR